MSSEVVINSVDQAPDWKQFGPGVRKIVLGRTPGEGGQEEKPLRVETLPDDFARRFPNLTHLYLWGLAGLRTLPSLPPKLECLDLRGCKDLTKLPPLPETLETLDLGGCAGLTRLPDAAPVHLRRFCFNGCAAVKPHSLAAFLERWKEAEAVEAVEIDGSGARAVTSLAEFPTTRLRKLVLKNCQNLVDIAGITAAKQLDHLNLSGCTGLRELPDLPEALRYLVLHGADNLASFLGQDIGPYDRGKQDENVIKVFRSRKRLGRTKKPLACAKVLLMGDGGAGKTTLIKRLKWEEMTKEQRAAKPESAPRKNEPYTRRVQFGIWETALKLDPAKQADLSARASSQAHLNWTKDGLLPGALRLWDFGGQELYHTTHRIFAREGSVFLIVWCPEEVEERPRPEGVGEEEWVEWNRKRSLDYWLDFVFSLKPQGARVALVCTRSPSPDRYEHDRDWRKYAPKYADHWPVAEPLPSFQVDSLADNCAGHLGYRKLVAWIREACGAEAARIGILQPAAFREASDYLDGLLAANEAARSEEREAQHLLSGWDDWSARLRANHEKLKPRGEPALKDDDVETITDTLHQAGQLFHIRYAGQRAVLIDQDWAAECIYGLLDPNGRLRKAVKEGGGLFHRGQLIAQLGGPEFQNQWAREQILAYMRECELITLLADARATRIGEDVYLASDKWLLPKYCADAEVIHADYLTRRLKLRVDAEMEQVRGLPGMGQPMTYSFADVEFSEFDYRSLRAHLARRFGVRGTYFRNLLQVMDPSGDPRWCLSVRWVPRAADGDHFWGAVEAVLVAATDVADQIRGEVLGMIEGEESPLHAKLSASQCLALGLRSDFSPDRATRPFDLGLSSCGADKEAAEGILKALQTAHYQPYFYLLEECRFDENKRLLEFMLKLLNQERMLLLVSENYLRNDPESNWYCAWELADAIKRLGTGQRSASDTMVTLKESPACKCANFRVSVKEMLVGMETFFRRKYADAVRDGDEGKFPLYQILYQCFAAALEDKNFNRFMEVCGDLGEMWIYRDISADGFKPLISKVAARVPPRT